MTIKLTLFLLFIIFCFLFFIKYKHNNKVYKKELRKIEKSNISKDNKTLKIEELNKLYDTIHYRNIKICIFYFVVCGLVLFMGFTIYQHNLLKKGKIEKNQLKNDFFINYPIK